MLLTYNTHKKENEKKEEACKRQQACPTKYKRLEARLSSLYLRRILIPLAHHLFHAFPPKRKKEHFDRKQNKKVEKSKIKKNNFLSAI